MKRLTLLFVVALTMFAVGVAHAVDIETVAIGNPGNVADTIGYGYGAVSYAYNIGKYEVTAGQYTAFLNSTAKASDSYGLYNASMWSDTTYGCRIQRSGGAGNYSYSVTSDYENKPVNYVSWYDTLRFANWMTNTSQGTGNGTESGAYTITGGGVNSGSVTMPNHATLAAGSQTYWMLSSENEWYKAAYYKKNGGYSLYANGTSTAPVAGTDSNYDSAIGSPWDGTISGALEQNGTKDMMGNVWEWNDAVIAVTSRGMRAGNWSNYSYYLDSSYRSYYYPANESVGLGFRVVSVPEPSTFVLLGMGAVGLLGLAWRRRKRAAAWQVS
jgi:sulfatase modifying factor 1